jgi:effector-binding domain-containing protein
VSKSQVLKGLVEIWVRTVPRSVLKLGRDDWIKGAARRPGALIRRRKESLMFLRFPLRIGAAAIVAAAALAVPQPSWAQAAPAAVVPTKPDAPPPATTEPGETFAQDTTLTAKMIVYVKGQGTWDDAFATISSAFKKLKAYTAKAGLKADGLPMTIFTSTDDAGFSYQAAVPVAEPPKDPPRGDIAMGQSPEGHALKFVHHGSYDDLDNTYEAITNYLDDKRLEAKDMFIEEYVTDPTTSDADNLTVNVLVLIK